MNGKRALITAGIAGLALLGICLSSSHDHANRPGQAARPHTTAPSSAPSNTTPPPSSAAGEVARLLPFGENQIADAAQVATRFTATYASHRFDEPPQAYLDRLAPMMSTQLRPVIAHAAADPATLDQRRRDHEVATAQARAEAIRTLGPTSITLLLTATTQVTTQHAARQETTRYAATLIHGGDGWRVYAIELAATGDTGEPSDDGNRP